MLPKSAKALVALLIAAALTVGIVGWLAGWHLGADSAVYRAGALTMLKGEQVYSDRMLTTLPSWVNLPFTYPPAAALLFLPLVAIPQGLIWGVVSALSVLSLAVVIRVFGVRTLWLPAAVAGALALEPVWKTLFLGQINLILMAVIVVDVLVVCRRGSRWGGVLIGMAAAVKLTPLIFIPHLFLTGRRADAFRALGTFVGLQALMFVVIPSDAAKYWSLMGDPGRVGAVHWIFDQSLNGMVSRASHLAPWSLTVALAIGAVLAVPAVWLVWRLHRRGDDHGALLVTAFYALLLSPVSWTHHWVWSVPLVVLLVTRGHRLAGFAVAALFACCVVMLVPNGGDHEFRWGIGLSVLGNAYVLAAALVLVVLAVREVRLLRTVPVPAQ
ncbi:glycosyltransferase 87 family protein [Amycolatopsis sp. cg5]|uniref:glycosyltransferase 87 family protein n=1 Tax=Amycolatopsis sp. cg5 TaxID=3238802 RepID=UPI003524C9E5